MGITAHVDYSKKAMQAYKVGSLLAGRLSQEYKFGDFKSVIISSIITTPYNDYTRSGVSRYGTPTEVEDETQELICTQDKGFTFAIDAGDMSDQAIDKAAGKALRREIDEVINPTMDKYRLDAWAKGAGNELTPTGTVTKNNILGHIIDANAMATEDLVPTENRTIFISVDWYKLLVQADAILSIDNLGAKAVSRGAVGTIDGCVVKPVPTSWMPEGYGAIIKYRGCTVDPVKLQNYDVLPKVQGFDGPVVQGRVYYDAFVLDAKKNGIVSIKTSA